MPKGSQSPLCFSAQQSLKRSGASQGGLGQTRRLHEQSSECCLESLNAQDVEVEPTIRCNSFTIPSVWVGGWERGMEEGLNSFWRCTFRFNDRT